MIAFAWIEWTWGEAILNESARDVVNLVGFGLTFTGLTIAWFQLRKTQSAANAAEAAARQALAECQFAYHKFAIAHAHRLLKEAQIHVDNEAWVKATMRLRDLRDQVNLLLELDGEWSKLEIELHNWSTKCDSLVQNGKKPFSKKKWLDFCRCVETKLNQMLVPFSGSERSGT